MKKEFSELIQLDLNQKYIDYLQNKGLSLSKEFHETNLIDREEKIYKKICNLSIEELKGYANPYYIGFGNPNSKILVIGKEKAFNPSNISLLIKESINNYSQWNQIITNKLFNFSGIKTLNLLGFNPLLPTLFHERLIKRNHTWCITNFLTRNLYATSPIRTNNDPRSVESLFENCFLTELNHIPSTYHEGSGLCEERKQILHNEFFKTFPIVIFSAKSYLKSNFSIVEDLFNVQYYESVSVGTIGKKRPRELTIDILRSQNQNVFVCNQLSGASGWSNEALNKFSETINKFQKVGYGT
jgi:hypothetical protein